jgi:hypothetical protein
MTSATPLVSAVPDELRGWMEYAVASGASDLHLVPGYPPVVRKHGDLSELPDPPLDPEELQSMLRAICSPEAFSRLVSRTTSTSRSARTWRGRSCGSGRTCSGKAAGSPAASASSRR